MKIAASQIRQVWQFQETALSDFKNSQKILKNYFAVKFGGKIKNSPRNHEKIIL